MEEFIKDADNFNLDDNDNLNDNDDENDDLFSDSHFFDEDDEEEEEESSLDKALQKVVDSAKEDAMERWKEEEERDKRILANIHEDTSDWTDEDWEEAAWEAMTFPIRAVIGLIEWLIGGFTSMQETITGVWDAIMGVIGPYVNQIVGFIMSLIGVFDQFKAGQMNLPQFIITILSMLWSAYLNVTTQIAQLILRFGGQVLTYAVNAGRNFLNGVMNQVKQTPGRVLSALLQVISSIVSAGQQWISNAVSQARGVVDGAAGALAALPGRISSALGGVVDAIVAPFRSAYDSVCGVVDQIKGKVEEGMQYLGSLVGFGGDTAFGGDVAISNDTARVVHSSEPLEVNENINLTLDLRNVPSGMDEDRLLDALNSREFIQAFVSNPVFQEADARVKRSISLKANRHMGV